MNNIKKLTGEEIIKILVDNYTLSTIGYGSWDDLIDDSTIKFSDGILKNDNATWKLKTNEILFQLGLGDIESIEQVGGEGEGEVYYVVYYFKDHDVYIRINGYYQSYHGTDWYNQPIVVTPQQKTITVYE